VNKDAGHFFLFRGNVPAAVLHYEKAVELMESDFHAWAMVSTCYRALGEAEKLRHSASKMVSEAERALQQDPSNGAALGIIAGGHAILGERDRAREWIDRALLIDPDNVNMRYNFACVLAGYGGDKEEALRLLAGSLALSTTHLRAAESDPDLDPLRDDPRFGKIVADARKRLDRGKQASSPALTIATPTG
jgi:adenylate cyclase